MARSPSSPIIPPCPAKRVSAFSVVDGSVYRPPVSSAPLRQTWASTTRPSRHKWTLHFLFTPCRALADQSILTSTGFTNRLVEIVGAMTNREIRIDAMLVLALSEYQRFNDTAEPQHLAVWHDWVTNAVAQTTSPSEGWRYGCSRFLDVAYHVMEENYAVAYEKATKTLVSLEQCQSLCSSNGLEYAVSGFYKMPGLPTAMALKALCGASAARLGYVGVATNYAFQVCEPHRTIILSLLGEDGDGK